MGIFKTATTLLSAVIVTDTAIISTLRYIYKSFQITGFSTDTVIIAVSNDETNWTDLYTVTADTMIVINDVYSSVRLSLERGSGTITAVMVARG